MRARAGGHRILAAALALAVVGLAAPRAEAQYFGQNKVQYKDLHFKILKTDHFDVYFYPEEQTAAAQAARMAERWYARFAKLFDYKLRGRQPIILYASHTDFEQTNAIEGMLGEATGGVTEPLKRRIVLPLGASLAETDHVIGHELVHAFQFDITKGGHGREAIGEEIDRLPLWFIEGMAEYLSLGPDDPNTAMWIRDAAGQEKLPDIKHLDDPKYFPYRWGQAFWAYVAGRYGDQVITKLLVDASADGDVDKAIKDQLKIDAKQLSKDWHAAIYDAYGPVQKATRRASDYGQLLITGRPPGGDMNVTPAISPDGSRLLFFSGRGLLSIDLYLADATSGKVLHDVVKTELDPHFSSLEFIDSAGSWSPDGRRFVFAGVHDGHPELVLFDLDRMAIGREIPLPSIDTILNPSWSPDGGSIAFSGAVGGLTDLFVYDLGSGALKRLTNDAFADLQPAWSPDSRHLVFVTDRFSTSITDLAPGDYRLGMADVARGAITAVPIFQRGKHTDPQWSPDGRAIYFLSDRNGITNVYRYDVASREVAQLTDLYTGVSGITALSPALSIAGKEGRAVLSVYEHGKYDIYAIDRPGALAGQPPEKVVASVPTAEELPPTNRLHEQLADLLAQPSAGLPEADAQVQTYHTHLSLDQVSQPSIGAGADRFGTYVAGGLTLQWSDMLGNQNLFASVQTGSYVGGGFSDVINNTAAAVGYENLAHRWNWGGIVEQFPYFAGGFTNDVLVDNGGAPAVVQQTTLLRQINRGVSAITAYPFNPVRRMEFSGGYQHVTFDEVTRTDVYDYASGALLDHTTDTTPIAGGLNLGTTSAAFVYDNAVFGATSPIDGQRSRFEVSPTAGSLFFTGITADYRHYFMPAKLYTIATRVMHYGRYGRDAEDGRLLPLFIGYPELVRGYDIGSFDASECVPDATDPCPAFDRLLGSRVLIGNLELRFPLLRPFGLREKVYGAVPVEVALFTDAGVAWDSHVTPAIFGGSRKGVASSGVAFRVNAFGFAIVQFDIAHPFQRPGKGWVFQFSLSPGF